jgi:4-hydroxyphenylacetate 3-monooxygenase
MGIRTGRQFLASLDDGRDVRIDGERVANVAQDHRFAGAAGTVAGLLDMQHRVDLQERMTYASPSTGERVGLSYIEPRDQADLVKRRGAISQWMEATQGMFGRSPDFMNCYIAAMGSASAEFAKADARFGANMRTFYEKCRENDAVMTHVLVNPQVDRSKTVENQDKDLAAKIVKETDAGIVIRGARMVATLAAFSNEIVVMPSSYIANTPDALDYSFGFSIETATPGMTFISRPSVVPVAASIYDHPLALRLDETDAMVIFNDVLVPWERVFLHRNPELSNGLYPRTFLSNQTGHQAAIKALAKSEFMLGLALALTNSTKIGDFLHVQGMIAEIMLSVQTVKACIESSEANAVATPYGTVAPDMMPLWVIRLGFPQMFHRMQEIIQLLGASGLVGAPSLAEFEGDARGMAAEYLQSVNQGAEDRAKLCRLAYDASISSFAGRQQLYERFYTGDPVRLAGLLGNAYPGKDALVGRIDDFLDRLPEFMTVPASAVAEAARLALAADERTAA